MKPVVNLYMDYLQQLHSRQTYRDLPEGRNLPRDDIPATYRSGMDFVSNDYLGLSRHPRLIKAACEACEQWGAGGLASRLLQRELASLSDGLEHSVAAWVGKPAALVLPTGYQANVSALEALLSVGNAWVLWDRLCHASLVDGIRASGRPWRRFRHNDADHLSTQLQKLRQHYAGVIWVVTESLFSMDGDLAPLTQLVAIAKHYGALVYVDEAHACGLYGQTRYSGLVEALGLTDLVDVCMGTFSKALGSQGGWLAADSTLLAVVVNRGRGFIYSTAMPPAVLAASQTAVELVQQDFLPRRRLQASIAHFHTPEGDALSSLTSQVGDKGSPIIPIEFDTIAGVMAAEQTCWAAGCYVKAIRPPTVPTPRLRLTLHAGQAEGTTIPYLRKVLSGLPHRSHKPAGYETTG